MMLKHLRVLVKWLAGLTLFIGAIIFVTYEEHRASDEYQRECQEHISAVSATLTEQQASGAEECQDPKNYMPWWYVLVGWPEGVTTWAIIATGFFIGWQSYETRRAANVSQRSIVLQFRPKVRIRKIALEMNRTFSNGAGGEETFNIDSWTIQLSIENIGGNPAHIQDGFIEIGWNENSPKRYKPLRSEPLKSFCLMGGEDKIISVDIPERGSQISGRVSYRAQDMLGGLIVQPFLLQVAGTIR